MAKNFEKFQNLKTLKSLKILIFYNYKNFFMVSRHNINRNSPYKKLTNIKEFLCG